MIFSFFKNNHSIESLPEFDNHHSVLFLSDSKVGLKGFIAIHRKNPNFPSFGATRMWHYNSETEALQDALRLSKMMSYKSALAGLSSGGAKGVIILPKQGKINRKQLLNAYAKKVDFLRGNFITGTDVGLFQEDLPILKETTKYIVGFNNYTTQLTALGIFCGIKTALENVSLSPSIKEKSFAIQGVGKVGQALLGLLYNDAKRIFIADIDEKTLRLVSKKYKNVIVVKPKEIHKQKVDVFCPCALSGAVTHKNVSELNCKIIAGGANNQLEDESIGVLLSKLNILYCPDYILNAGGLIAVVNEYEALKFNYQKVKAKVLAVKENLNNIFQISKREGKSTNIVANQIAEKIFNNY